MKKINIGFLAIVLLCFSFKVSAQVAENIEKDQDTILQKITYKASMFSDNMFVEAAIGTQVLFSKDASKLDFVERFTPFFSLGLGKWFSPYWAARIQMQGFSLNGFSTLDGIYLADPQSGSIYGNNDPVRNFVIIRPDGSYRHFVRYLNATLDFQLSIMSLIKGYEENRRVDIIPAVGIGYMCVFDYKGIPNTNTISTNFELMGKYRLNNKLDLNLKFQTAILPDHFEGRIAGNKYENYSSASIGVTYYLKKRGFKEAVCPPNIPIIKEVKETDTLYQVVYKIDTVYKEIHKVDTIRIVTARDFESELGGQIENKSEKKLEKEALEIKYQVKEGDHLYSIARNYYKNVNLWPLIYKVNSEIIHNPEVLLAGDEIKLSALQGTLQNLTAKDKKDIAQSYLEVYLYYKNIDHDKALHYLWVGKNFDSEVLSEYADRIKSGDKDLLNKFK